MTGDIRYFVFLPRDVKIEQLFAAAEQNYTSHAKINAIYKIDYKVLLAKKLVPYRSRPRKKKKRIVLKQIMDSVVQKLSLVR